ncbi:pentapeptide repeat-containing protein [Streptomyces sp. FXJ1.172]|uniref:pentapeptide repeat-containing protein n=1 Tax=Streptomyces sp. FXJ1.172 TaxID=710705 RepID=UPI0023DCF650|nr:pentapeptide repeat-containing protein [Streptomyces sp. FXJ1.172]WEO93280.1 pentapeptide repeat-containing protein [Streptomyces sp. FXJ1.172]
MEGTRRLFSASSGSCPAGRVAHTNNHPSAGSTLGAARFDGAQFSSAWFGGAQFSDAARFDGARFEGVSVLGPLVCAEWVTLSGAVFVMPVTLEIAARRLACQRTRWKSTAILTVRYAAVDLSHAVLTAPAAVHTHPTPFIHNNTAMSEDPLVGLGQVRIGVGMSRWQVGQVPAQRARSVCSSRTAW